MTINAKYSQLNTTRESSDERDGRAILLVEGTFATTEALELTESSDAPAAVGSHLESWSFDIDGDTSHTMRYLAPDGRTMWKCTCRPRTAGRRWTPPWTAAT